MRTHKLENSLEDFSSSGSIAETFEDGSVIGQTISEFLADYLKIYPDAQSATYTAPLRRCEDSDILPFNMPVSTSSSLCGIVI